ncbi:Uncharacterised protein [Yersinia intermedia]|jgi:predicted glycosyltransferase involved in capsule biosynthesis|uniref:galactosyltransferase-related protein n=1 Tax=Yersinia intermedia TaxID=631 RepID=UPI0005E65194|nr:galactosyltransferase-related protein [Yersinia intermedia]UZM72139.1 galactosyltransferase-related protein [Yersinia intermedia]CNC50533.1 Uncharacterised protein [Yersinia intermedia]CNG92233.1 Uncharacterised protein [Yersinia intermedia]CQJ67094.1 Uncharacterised protein [Yersinia intermedia]
MLTVIIPIDLKTRAKDIISKSINLATEAEKHKVNIVFGHNDRGTRYDKLLKKRLSNFSYSKLKSQFMASEKINSSLLRNIAFDEVVTKHVILLDVDIYPDFTFFLKYSDKLESDQRHFFIFPCLYLTKYGTKLLSNNLVTKSDLKKKFYNFSRKEFLHIASPSSITIMRSNDYRKLGGFDIEYEGHGYEDFDFLIRLSKLYRINDKYNDFLNNKIARSPLFAVGFRKYLGELCLEFLLKKEMVFHLYHKKNNHDDYYISRKKNFERFTLIHGNTTTQSLHHGSTLIKTFVNLCNEKNISIHDYSILFENKPGHIDRFDTFRRKFNFLFNK